MSSKEKYGILNYYTCPVCNYYWEDEWDCEVEDDCPSCGHRHITPKKSILLTGEYHE